MKEENTELTLSSELDPFEYSIKMGYKPLTKKELKKGKNINVYNTKTPMPWEKIYAHIRLGLPYEHLHDMYGKLRKIILFAVRDGVKYEETANKLMSDEYEQRIALKSAATVDPVLVQTMQEAVNAYAPDVRRDVTIFGQALITRAIKMVNDEDTRSSDISNLANAVQTVTDTLSVTERHASAANHTTNNIAVEGFDFSQMSLPSKAIDAEVVEKEYTIEELDAMTVDSEVYKRDNEVDNG